MVRRSLLFALALTACSGNTSNLAGATTMTALALGAAAAERSAGGCVAICTNGTTCNTKTGFCEQLPCRGRGGENEHCEETFAESRCVPGGTTGVVAEAKGTQPKTPVVAPITTPPDSNH